MHCYDLEHQFCEDHFIEDPDAPITLLHLPIPQTVQLWLNGERMTGQSFDVQADLVSLMPLKEGDTLTIIYNPQKESRGERLVRRLRGSATALQGKSTDEIMVELRGEPDH